MGLIIYNIFLGLFRFGVRIAAIFNNKASKWVKGRRRILEKMADAINPSDQVIWMHCASLGEFEQGRPLFEKLRTAYPGYKFLLTFFSPSGFEIRKDYQGADWVFYLPLDGPRTAKRFLEIAHPSLAIFVKYEFWYYYLKKMKYRNTPILLVSAIFRKDAIFFRWYGQMQRKMLSRFNHLFVQNQSSKDLLQRIDLEHKTTVTGDTRFDRVIEIAESGAAIPTVETFLNGKRSIVAGSSWPGDEKVLQEAISSLNESLLKLIIAPHEIHAGHVQDIQQLFPDNFLFSQVNQAGYDPQKLKNTKVLIIDNIGMLSRLYRYGNICYVGGGFESGIHNTLEAAVYGRPVIFGPDYSQFAEARDLIALGGGFSIRNAKECSDIVRQLLGDEMLWKNSCKKAKEYVYANQGASQKIINYIQEKRLLTN